MEIDITQFVNDECPVDFSASVAEIGNDAGRQTWSAAMETAPDYLAQFITNTDARDELTRWIRGFGAWNDAEIAAWSDTELCALLIQFIAGDLREGGIRPGMVESEWAEYYARAEEGQISGRIYPGDDGRIYFYMGE